MTPESTPGTVSDARPVRHRDVSGGDAQRLRCLFERRAPALFRIATLLTGDTQRASDLVVVLFRRLGEMTGVDTSDLTLVQLVRSMWAIASRGEPVAYEDHHIVALGASGELNLSDIVQICELPRPEVASMLRSGLDAEYRRRVSERRT